MPCRREEEEEAGEEAEGEAEEEEEDSFLLLEQSVTLGGSGEVDLLVAQIGETLQLDAAQDSPASPCAPPGPPLQPPRPPAAVRADKARPPALPLLLPPAPAEAVGPAPPGALRCALGDRGRVRGRAAPYFVAELAAGPSALPGPCRRGWLRGAVASRRLQQRRWPPAGTRARDDDPHRLLQQLVLSGNLIKEAVRRLQEPSPRWQPRAPRAPLGPAAAAHRTLSPCSPPAPCTDPGRREEERDAAAQTRQRPALASPELKPPPPPPPPPPWERPPRLRGDAWGDLEARSSQPRRGCRRTRAWKSAPARAQTCRVSVSACTSGPRTRDKPGELWQLLASTCT
ncbi:LOW QUALITY PROTEIN: GSK-3-binding protein FRAT2-like [Vulpes lagopus]|uniref:LOW QUALITY PROTEIN: GSK-3-binding protein FRAT2-like n=1 Tax=Vulpes lagopus TaxID=494514 RepID=UPI001BC9A731|nr:LOW QUALITY PROTEIN: GSK-3-binding protein FRAT2-like [Vulpes lagopus]